MNTHGPWPLAIITTVFLAVVVALLGWTNQLRIASLSTMRDGLIDNAGKRGIQVDEIGGRVEVRHKRCRLARSTTIGTSGCEGILIYLRTAKSQPKWPCNPTEILEFERKKHYFSRQFQSLSNDQLRILAEEILTSSGLSDGTSQAVLRAALLRLANGHPAKILDYLTESGADGESRLRDPSKSRIAVADILGSWAEADPRAAVEWFKQHGAGWDRALSRGIGTHLAKCVACRDIRLALQLLDDLGENSTYLAKEAFSQPETCMDGRLDRLSVLREWAARIDDDAKRSEISRECLEVLVFGPYGQRARFEDAVSMLDSPAITEEERSRLLDPGRLADSIDFADAGRWLDWIHRQLPSSQANETSMSLAEAWADKDHLAVEHWIIQTPDSPLRVVAAAGLVRRMWWKGHSDAEIDRIMLRMDKDERVDVVQAVCLRILVPDPDQRPRLDAWADRHGTRFDWPR